MADESKGTDPYEAALVDLYKRREQLDNLIAGLESLRGSGMPPINASAAATMGPFTNAGAESGSLLGMSISDAAKKLLAQQRRPIKNPELAMLFKQGGLHLNSKDWTNTIGAVLTRRFQEVGDIVKLDRGTWGLKEWYPNRSFKKDKEGPIKGEGEKPEEAKGAVAQPPAERRNPFADFGKGKLGVKKPTSGGEVDLD